MLTRARHASLNPWLTASVHQAVFKVPDLVRRLVHKFLQLLNIVKPSCACLKQWCTSWPRSAYQMSAVQSILFWKGSSLCCVDCVQI